MKVWKKKRILLLALILSCLVSACTKNDEKESGKDETIAPLVTQESTAEEDLVDYTVTVVDEKGNPIPNAMVQLCLDVCYPGATDEQGVAKFEVEEADYKVAFLTLPKGYTYTTEEQEFTFAEGSSEMTIVLKKS